VSTPLRSVLAHAPSGLYQVRSPLASTRLRIAARAHDVHLHCVESNCIGDKRTFLTQLAHALHLPAWFGMNWDAMADSLTDLRWEPGSTQVVWLKDMRRFARRSPPEFETALAVFEEASLWWLDHDVHLLVLVGTDRLPTGIWLPQIAAG
jgi:RNAse (barnase) inhibitor barstar